MHLCVQWEAVHWAVQGSGSDDNMRVALLLVIDSALAFDSDLRATGCNLVLNVQNDIFYCLNKFS